MKFLNDFKNLFAIVGVVSIIFWTCASESTSTNVNPPQLSDGIYQVEVIDSGNIDATVGVLNTQTGAMKLYTVFFDGDTQFWGDNDNDITFTH